MYALADRPLECVKLYTKTVSSEDERKLRLMVESPPRDPSYDARQHRSICWPTALVFEGPRPSRWRGFLMPRLDLKRFGKALSFIDPADRTERFGGGFTWKYLYTAACNLASAVAALHERGYCIGDLNESNVLIAPNALLVLVDCDSFQVRDAARGRVYRCMVGKAEYTAPELLGRAYRDVDRTPATDAFALAVMLFQLLMEGTHPYQAKGKLVEHAPTTDDKLRQGLFPYRKPRPGLEPPDYAPPYEILHPRLRELFERAFEEGHRKPDARPSPEAWFLLLRELGNEFRKCPTGENHFYLGHLTSCPWCELARTRARDPFPGSLGQQIALAEPDVKLDTVERRRAYFRSYLEMALADGTLTEEEEDYLEALGNRLQIPQAKSLIQGARPRERQRPRKIHVPVGTPELEVSEFRFNPADLRRSPTASGSFTIANVGSGVLQGRLASDRPWLLLAQTQIDPGRHKQEIGFTIASDPWPEPLDTGAIEIRSNAGDHALTIDLREALGAQVRGFRRALTATGILAGALVGHATSVLLAASVAETSALVASGAALIAAPVALVRSFGRGSGLADVRGGIVALGIGGAVALLAVRAIPSVGPAPGWAALSAGFLYLFARHLFVRRQHGRGVATAIGLGAVVLLAGVLGAGLGLSDGNFWQLAPFPRGPVLTLATQGASGGRPDGLVKNRFNPGEELCLVAETGGFQDGARLRYEFELLSPINTLIGSQSREYRLESRDRHFAAWSCFQVPKAAQPGIYTARVSVADGFRSEVSATSGTFTVMEPSRPAKSRQAERRRP